MNSFLNLSYRQVRRTGDQSQLTGLYSVQTDHTYESVSAAFTYGDTRDQTHVSSCLFGQATNQHAHLYYSGRQFLYQIFQTDGLVEVYGIAAFLRVVIPTYRSTVDAGGVLAGQLVHQPVGALVQTSGLVVSLRLIFLQPQSLGRQTLGRNHAVAVILQSIVTGGSDSLGLFGSSYVHPHDSGAQRLHIVAGYHYGTAGGIYAHALDAGRVDITLSHGTTAGLTDRIPPLLRLLLSATGRRSIQRIRLIAEYDGVTL